MEDTVLRDLKIVNLQPSLPSCVVILLLASKHKALGLTCSRLQDLVKSTVHNAEIYQKKKTKDL